MEKQSDDDSLDAPVKSTLELEPIDSEVGAGIFGGAFNLANSALGAGLLTFPNSFALTGVGAGIFLQMVFGIVTFYTVVLCGEAARLTSSDSFTLICLRLFGRRAQRCSIFFLISFAWLGCIAYLTVIGTQLEVFGRALVDDSEDCAVDWYLRPMFTTSVVGTIVVFPLASLRDMRTLASASVVAVGACWYVTAFVTMAFFVFEPTAELNADATCAEGNTQEFHDVTFWSFIVAVPAICFGYHCQICSIPNYAALNATGKKHYSALTAIAVIVCMCTYTTVGFFGSMTFGGCASSKKLILDNYPSNNMAANLGRVFVAIAVSTSYPVVGFVGRQELSNILESACRERDWTFSNNVFLSTPHRRLFSIGLLWYVSTLLFAIFVPEIKWVIYLTGIICSISIFMLPGSIAMLLANLYSKNTFAKTLQQLPDAEEDSPDCWAYDIRNRIPGWLSSNRRSAVWWSGAILVAAGFSVLAICIAIIMQDISVEIWKEPRSLRKCE